MFDRRSVASWISTSHEVGIYDYIYGDEIYKIPRLYTRTAERYLKFAYNQGVSYYYAEAYPGPWWLEGPKLYVYSKLLWDVEVSSSSAVKNWVFDGGRVRMLLLI